MLRCCVQAMMASVYYHSYNEKVYFQITSRVLSTAQLIQVFDVCNICIMCLYEC